MIGNDRQMAGRENQESYENVVLDFLNRELAAAQLTPRDESQSDELDALVSNLLKQVMTESDSPQAGRRDAPTLREVSQQEYAYPKTAASAFEIHEEEPALPADFNPSGDGENMFAEFMPSPDGSAASQIHAGKIHGDLQLNRSEDELDLLSEYMRLQEKRSVESADAQSDADLDSIRFEGMDDVLAEYVQPEHAAPGPQDESESPESEKHSAQSEDADALYAELPPLSRETPEMATGAAPDDSEPVIRCTTKEEPAPDGSIPAQKTSAATVTNCREPEVSHPEAIRQSEIPGEKPAHKSDAVLSVPAQKPAPAPSAPRKTGTTPKHPIFAAPAARRSKTPLITAAALFVLAAIAVPVLYHYGDKANMVASQIPAAGQSTSPNGEVPAVPILQVSPLYPETAIKNRESASVTLELSIDSEGNVVKAVAIDGPVIFQDEAIRAALKWRYKPALRAGAKVAGKSRVTLNFNMKK